MTNNNNHVWTILNEDDYRCVNCDIRYSPNKENQECSYVKTSKTLKYKDASHV